MTSPPSKLFSGTLPTNQCQNSDRVLHDELHELRVTTGSLHQTLPIPSAVDVQVGQDDRVERVRLCRPSQHGVEPRGVRLQSHPRKRPHRTVAQFQQVLGRTFNHLGNHLPKDTFDNVLHDLCFFLYCTTFLTRPRTTRIGAVTHHFPISVPWGGRQLIN